jgi:hypothetical protein
VSCIECASPVVRNTFEGGEQEGGGLATGMKKNTHAVLNRVLAGLIFLVVLFAIVLLLHRLWQELSGPGN